MCECVGVCVGVCVCVRAGVPSSNTMAGKGLAELMAFDRRPAAGRSQAGRRGWEGARGRAGADAKPRREESPSKFKHRKPANGPMEGMGEAE